MEASSQNTSSGGLWNNPRSIQCSKETQDMLRLMKEESQLTNLHKKPINRDQKALPQTSKPAKSSHLSQSIQKHPPLKSQRRSAESCRSGGNYEREKFRPGPIRDLEKEKKRLQDIMAKGKESTLQLVKETPACVNSEVVKETDRYQEVLDEIEERRQFLADMAALGHERKYASIINTEIAQKLQELKILDQASSDKQDAERQKTVSSDLMFSSTSDSAKKRVTH